MQYSDAMILVEIERINQVLEKVIRPSSMTTLEGCCAIYTYTRNAIE